MTQAEIDEAYYPKMFSQVNYNNCDVNCHVLFSFLSVFLLIVVVWLGVSKSTFGHRYMFRVLLHFSDNSAGWGGVLPLQLATL